MSYAIFDKGHRYIPRTWSTQREAELELYALLRPYPKDSAWRVRLTVREVCPEKDTLDSSEPSA